MVWTVRWEKVIFADNKELTWKFVDTSFSIQKQQGTNTDDVVKRGHIVPGIPSWPDSIGCDIKDSHRPDG